MDALVFGDLVPWEAEVLVLSVSGGLDKWNLEVASRHYICPDPEHCFLGLPGQAHGALQVCRLVPLVWVLLPALDVEVYQTGAFRLCVTIVV